MPAASDELRAMWEDDAAALAYLESRGIKEPKTGLLLIPNGFELSHKDACAIRYMMDEWDYAWKQDGSP